MKVNISNYPNYPKWKYIPTFIKELWYKLQGGDEGRKSTVKISKHDTYSLDHTLALVILPALIEYKKYAETAIIGNLDKEDYPPHLARPELIATGLSNEARCWSWFIDELIWTFEQIVEDDEKSEDIDRINNGLRLFGKYYRKLWW